ncbi:glycosyltransferase family 2 protein [Pelatocladus sp. BLCC-F211]|uniref:glycosyltransferase family 2 protein n=1 Tax=Pelatocladus sp. BLCC-F211 TaxID=3342752 RepID=UPI0035B99C9C
MSKLVSVIIPCFNAEKWLKEAIDSCLQQTYPNLEILVINDGSTDNSLEILKTYGNRIIWKSLPHQGGNHVRNYGFHLSKGEYIQYLDADDYILPEKIARQVNFLETTGADVVYGDWRYKHHYADGTSFLAPIQIAQSQADILESLLANWWTAVASLLYKRSAVENSNGWDENLLAAQDRDFFLSVVMSGAKVVYQPGCYAVYRRYGNVTVSTYSKSRWVECQHLVLQKAQNRLLQSNKLILKYRYALALSYFELARESLRFDYSMYLRFLEKTLILSPDFKHPSKRITYNLIQNILGFRHTERIFLLLLSIKKLIKSLNQFLINTKEKFSVIS